MTKRVRIYLLSIMVFLLLLIGMTMSDAMIRQSIFGPNYNGIPLRAWQRLLREENVPERLQPVYGLFFAEPNDAAWDVLSLKDQHAILLTLKNDVSISARARLAGALHEFPPSQEVTQLMKQYLNDTHETVRVEALSSMGRIKTPLTELLPDLFRMLNDVDTMVVIKTYVTLGEIGKKNPSTVLPDTITLLTSGEELKQQQGLDILIEIIREGSASIAYPAIPSLLPLASSSNKVIRKRAFWLIGKLIVKDAIPLVLNGLSDSDYGVRNYALGAVVAFGPECSDAVPILVKLLDSINPKVEHPFMELQALFSIGEMAREAIPVLLKLRETAKGNMLENVEKTLRKLDPERFGPPFTSDALNKWRR